MKYKLIKEYPGSPELNTICEYTNNLWNDANVFINRILNLKDYPEFWQPIVEKDYEILSLVSSEKNPQHKKGSKFLHNKDYKFKNMHPTEFWDIYSVKRISDNKIFTIGDSYEDLIIEKMFMSVAGDILTTYKPKFKQPLFTTEDGIDIFEGDTIYWVNINTFEKVNYNKYNDDLGEISIKSLLSKKYECKAIGFSTNEKAEEYILLNKPVLSYGEIQEYLKVKDCNKVLDLVQSKIQQSV